MCDIIWNATDYFWDLTFLPEEHFFKMCTIFYNLDEFFLKSILHLMHIPVLILILITLIGKDSEDSKWFVFHTAVLNLILGIIWEVSYFLPYYGPGETMDIILVFSLNLSVNSIFPLDLTKYLSL